MKREELKAMGLTDEQVESVMAKNGAEVAALNTQITTLQSEKSQLENDKKVITKEKEDKEKAIADLQKNSISKDEYDKKIKEIEENAKKENEDYIYNDLLNKGLDDAKVLKDDLTREAFISLLNKNKDKITFNNNDIKYSIKCNDNEIMMIRDGNDFVNTFIFNNNNSKSNYLLKENGYDMDMEVNVSNMKSNDKLIYIEYEIVSTSCKYEFKIEMSEML